MTRNYFGTDGIRGTANVFPVTAEVAMKLGMAAGVHFNRGAHRHRVVIAKDTRLSGYLLEPALTAGFISVGMDVLLVGPMPTPAVAMLTRSMRADLGVMISASHNPFADNGLKLFGPDGFKLSDETEAEIERLMHEEQSKLHTAPSKLGRAKRLEDAQGRYIEYTKATYPKGKTLSGMKVVIDCSHGAAYKVAPTVLWELGAEVISIGVEPNGVNINDNVGSTAPGAMRREVLRHGADVGIALDGDADRLVMCDEMGRMIDGDQLMAMVATFKQKQGELTGDAVVATQMSNMGLERYLNDIGLKLYRTKVGDRYVMEGMKKYGCNVGGEQSGHVILSDYSTTGDGLIAALQVLALIRDSEKPASMAGQIFKPLPQVLRNVEYKKSKNNPLDAASVKKAITSAERKLGGNGRVFVRKSGTEPLIRVMVEGEDEIQVNEIVSAIAEAVIAAK